MAGEFETEIPDDLRTAKTYQDLIKATEEGGSLPAGWSKIPTSYTPVPLESGNPDVAISSVRNDPTGYSAEAYINETTKQVVIVNKGIDLRKAWDVPEFEHQETLVSDVAKVEDLMRRLGQASPEIAGIIDKGAESLEALATGIVRVARAVDIYQMARAQFQSALDLTQEVVASRHIAASDIMQIGQGTGGGIAALMSAATGSAATTFNATGVKQFLPAIQAEHGFEAGDYSGRIKAYRVKGDANILFGTQMVDDEIELPNREGDFASELGAASAGSIGLGAMVGLLASGKVPGISLTDFATKLGEIRADQSALGKVSTGLGRAIATRDESTRNLLDIVSNPKAALGIGAGLALLAIVGAGIMRSGGAGRASIFGGLTGAACKVQPDPSTMAATGGITNQLIVAGTEGQLLEYVGSTPRQVVYPTGEVTVEGGMETKGRPIAGITNVVALAVDVRYAVIRPEERGTKRGRAAETNVALLKDGSVALWTYPARPPITVFTLAQVTAALKGRTIVAIQDGGKFFLSDGTVQDGVLEKLQTGDDNLLVVRRREPGTFSDDRFIAMHEQVDLAYHHEGENVPLPCIRKVTRGYVLTQDGDVKEVREPEYIVSKKPFVTGVRDIASELPGTWGQLAVTPVDDSGSVTLTIAAKEDGSAWWWSTKYTLPENGAPIATPSVPQKIEGLSDIRRVVSTGYVLWFLTNGGKVWQWRRAENDGHKVLDNRPELVTGLNSVKSLVAWGPYMGALTESGAVYLVQTHYAQPQELSGTESTP